MLLLGTAISAPPVAPVPPPAVAPPATVSPPSSAPGVLSTAAGFVSQQRVVYRQGDIVYTLSTNRPWYGADDPVDITFTVANAGADNAVFEFPSTQNYDFAIRHGNDELARWSLGQTFVQTPTSLTLAPGHSFSFTTRWLQKDQYSHSVPPGVYTLEADFPMIGNVVEVTLQFTRTR